MSLSQDQIDGLLSLPALEPPPGITANFDDPPNRNGLAYFVTTICVVISSLCVLIRLYSKVSMEKRLRVEEGLMICAYVSVTFLLVYASNAILIMLSLLPGSIFGNSLGSIRDDRCTGLLCSPMEFT